MLESISKAQSFAVTIPEGTRVSSGKATLLFAATQPAEITAGDTEILIPAQCDAGYVKIYSLMQGGELPSQEVWDSGLEICTVDDVKSLTDCAISTLRN